MTGGAEAGPRACDSIGSVGGLPERPSGGGTLAFVLEGGVAVAGGLHLPGGPSLPMPRIP